MKGSAPFPSGLCAHCRHAEILTSKRNFFLRCRRADADPRLARYPRLPVIACAGYEPVESDSAAPPEPSGR